MEKPDLASYLSEYILNPGAMNKENFRKRRELTWKQIQYCYYCVRIYGAAPLEHIAELYNEYEQADTFAGKMMGLYADTRLFIASGDTPAELEHMKHRENS